MSSVDLKKAVCALYSCRDHGVYMHIGSSDIVFILDTLGFKRPDGRPYSLATVKYWIHGNKIRAVHISNRAERMDRAQERGTHSKQEWLDLKAKFGNRCVSCWMQEPQVKLTKDHIRPVQCDDSTDEISNIQPLCLTCNVGNVEQVNYRDLREEGVVWRDAATCIPATQGRVVVRTIKDEIFTASFADWNDGRLMWKPTGWDEKIDNVVGWKLLGEE